MRITFLTAIFLLVSCAASGQEFEAASVKPTTFDNLPMRWRGGPGTDMPGQISYSRIRLWDLIRSAYGLRPDQIDGPPWILSEWYTVAAKIPAGTSQADFRLMLQHLLAARFHLELHGESREAPGYELTLAKGGPKLTASPEQPKPPADAKPDPDGFPTLPAGVASRNQVVPGIEMNKSTHWQTTAEFSAELGSLMQTSSGGTSGPLSPRVVDKTGLEGKYFFTLEYAWTQRYTRPSLDAADASARGPTIFSAVEKQLGLKLVKSAGVPVEVLVVDKADRIPVGN